MSWLAEFAGKAEDFLNKIDKNAAVVLHTPGTKENLTKPKKSEPFIEPVDSSNSRQDSVATVDSLSPVTGSSVNENLKSTNSGVSGSETRRSNNNKAQSQTKKIASAPKESKTVSSASNSTKPNSSVNRPVNQNGVDRKKVAKSSEEETRTNEDDLIAYLNSSESTGLNETVILKNEVENQSRELKLLTKNHRSLQKDHEDLKQKLQMYKDKLAREETTRHNSEAEEQDLKKLLEEREKEVSDLSCRHQQALQTLQQLEVSQENLQKLEQCLLDNSHLKSENETLVKRTEILASQAEAAENHVLSMKSTLSSMEKEFANYKEKAKSILSYKDELIASLKNDGSSPRSDTSSSSAEELMAEVTALKNERELLQADLSQTRTTVESLKDDTVRLEKEVSTLRSFTEDLGAQLHREKETVGSLQSENLQVCQQLTSLQFQLEREKNERKRCEEQVAKYKESSGNSSDSSGQNGYLSNSNHEKELSKLKTRVNALSQSLYEKQSLINDLSTDKQLFQIEVERLKNELRDCRIESNEFCHGSGLPQTVIASQPLYLSESPWDSRVSAKMKRIYTQIDAVFCQFGLALRKRPTLRLGMSFYVVILHLWVFFVLFSWMHHAVPEPE
ncbi:Golgin-84 [Orchesella cincta]|uniref:Golgin-84 n=1 Tax=Orchesella cincta TaxID=48709 RepID=A0A1D2N059_ORCCI|nr:Golgin-84 [Orchesella cincta]